MPLYLLLIGGGLIGRAAAVNWIATVTAALQSTPVVLHVRRTTAHSSAIDSAANNFMQAMMGKDWASMWSMLSPDAQRLYQGEPDFARFEQAKFGAITLIAFKASAAQLQQPWLDPDTTFIYPIAATLQVSLEATAPRGLLTAPSLADLNIGQPPAYTTTQKELLDSKNTLQAQSGKPVQFFCYPTGEPFHHDSYYERQLVLADLLVDGYAGATLDPFSFDSTIQNARTSYQLPRIRVNGGESLLAFTGILNVVLKYDAARLG